MGRLPTGGAILSLTASVYSELSSNSLHRRRGRSEVGPGLARSSRREASLGYLGRGEVGLGGLSCLGGGSGAGGGGGRGGFGCGGGGGGPGFGFVALAREVGRVLRSGCFFSGSLFFVLIAAGALVT